MDFRKMKRCFSELETFLVNCVVEDVPRVNVKIIFVICYCYPINTGRFYNRFLMR